MNSPLGQYGQIVAAITAVGIIGTYLFALLFGVRLGMSEAALSALDNLAFLAAGAVFGAAAAVNGVKAPITAAHQRIDKLETGTGIPTHDPTAPPS